MSRRIDEVNYLVLTLRDLSEYNRHKVNMSVLKSGAEQVFAGTPVNFPKAIQDARQLNLIETDSDRIALTRFGNQFAKINGDKSFEAKIEQILFLRAYADMTELGQDLSSFLSDQKTHKESASLINEIFNGERSDTTKQNIIDKIYIKYSSGISEDDLEIQLHEKRIYGAKAEDFILNYEIERLRKNGLENESKLVRRVGNTDITKGYDIESFTSSCNSPNRFIEVKCTKNPFLRFYWSKNEVDVAKRLGENYFIYFVWIDSDGEPEGSPEIIRNPAITILEDTSKFIVSTGTLVIRGV